MQVAYSVLLSGNCVGEGDLDLGAKRKEKKKAAFCRLMGAFNRNLSQLGKTQPGCGMEAAGGREGGGSPP